MHYGIVVTPQAYEAACQSGYDYVELAGRTVAAMTDADFDELKVTVLAGRLPCLAFNAYCPPEIAIIGEKFSRGSARDYAERLARRASALGVRVVGVGSPFSRMRAPELPLETAWEQATAFMRETSRAFAPYGVTVCIEALGPCYCNFINRLEEAEALRKLTGEPNLELVVDFYNMERSGEPELSLEAYAAHIAHAHISDDAGSPRARSYLKPEKEALHASRLRRLKDVGYANQRISLEIDVPFDAPAAAQSLAMLKQTECD